MHSKQDHKNNIISSECQRGRRLRAMGLRSGNKGKDAFVVVSYDFEYITEEGKEVIFLPIFQPFLALFLTSRPGVDERGGGSTAPVQNQRGLVAGLLKKS